MKLWHEKIRFTAPLKEVDLVAYGSLDEIWEERLRDCQQTAFEQGREAGERALSEQLIQQRAEMQDLEMGVLKSLSDSVPQLVRQMEPMLIELALEAARKLVADLPITQEIVETVVRDALGQLDDSSELTVLLHPEDLELLRRTNSPVLNLERLRFAHSQEVTHGGCIVQTRFGYFDARRETKIKLLREVLQL